MKVLNLYSGIGGNRKLWEDVDVTAVEINEDVAKVYQDYFPEDEVIVDDAHQYLLEHYGEYDFNEFDPKAFARDVSPNGHVFTEPELQAYKQSIREEERQRLLDEFFKLSSGQNSIECGKVEELLLLQLKQE